MCFRDLNIDDCAGYVWCIEISLDEHWAYDDTTAWDHRVVTSFNADLLKQGNRYTNTDGKQQNVFYNDDR